MTTRKPLKTREYVDAAEALQRWFKSQNLPPAESTLVFALLNAMWMRDARREGKTATVDIYTDTYRSSLTLWDSFVADALKEG